MTIADIPPSESACILVNLNHVLRDHFQISHTTIQFEHIGCEDLEGCVAPPIEIPSGQRIHITPQSLRRGRDLSGSLASLPSARITRIVPELGEARALIQRRLFLAGLVPRSHLLHAGLPRWLLSSWRRPPRRRSLMRLAGHYTDPSEPAGGFDFYVQDGKLIVESARMVPTRADLQFQERCFRVDGIGTTRSHSRSTASGRGASVSLSDQPSIVYLRTGEPVHHVFHDYLRTEVMIPMRDGVKLHAVILKPADIAAPAALPDAAHALRRRRHDARLVLCAAPGTGARRLHLRRPRTFAAATRARASS